jgi:hypothetical protein
MGTTVVEGDFEYQIAPPDKFRRKESLSPSGGDIVIAITQVLDGMGVLDDSSIGGSSGGDFGQDGQRGGGGRGGRGNVGNIATALLGGLPIPADASPEVREDLQRRSIASDMERLLMAVLLHSQTPVVWIGVAESPDGTADVLEFVTPDDEATRLLVDTKTRMPLMMSWTGVAPQFGNRGGNNRGGGGGRGGQPQGGQQGGGQQGGRGRGQANAPTTITMYLSDYKTVNGMKLPHLLQRGPTGETTEEYAIKSYKVNQSFKADLFKTTK